MSSTSAEAVPEAPSLEHPPRVDGWLPVVLIALLFVGTLAAVQLIGLGSRGGASLKEPRTAADSNDVFDTLLELGIRGRSVVFVGDEYTASGFDLTNVQIERALIDGTDVGRLGPSTLPYATMVFGISRRVYLVSPSQAESAQPESATHVNRLAGVPTMRIASGSVPDLGEKAVVVMSEDAAQRLDAAARDRLTGPAFADVVIVQVTK